MTGGIGRKRLTDFYRDHFIWQNPDDIKLNLVSRTIGVDRIVDEFISCFTHDKEIDWLYDDPIFLIAILMTGADIVQDSRHPANRPLSADSDPRSS